MSADKNESDEEYRQRLLEDLEPHKYQKAYRAVFGNPKADWRVECLWTEAYYHASHLLIEGVARRSLQPQLEGVVALYLFRHYLELALKYIVLHARWLKDKDTNAHWDEITEVKKTHSLAHLWHLAKDEALPKIEEEHWKTWDLAFVDACVAEFDQVDPQPGERFRYFGKVFGGPKSGRGDEALSIDYVALFLNMPQVRAVLEAIDSWLYETHGQNAEWQAEMDSW